MSEKGIYMLSRLTHLRRNTLKARFAELEFSMGMYSALRELKTRKTIPQSELLDTEMDRAAVSRLLRRLVDRGLVNTITDQNDRRQTILSITDDGLDALRVMDEICVQEDNKLLKGFSAEEIVTLEGLARRMLENYQKELRR